MADHASQPDPLPLRVAGSGVGGRRNLLLAVLTLPVLGVPIASAWFVGDWFASHEPVMAPNGAVAGRERMAGGASLAAVLPAGPSEPAVAPMIVLPDEGRSGPGPQGPGSASAAPAGGAPDLAAPGPERMPIGMASPIAALHPPPEPAPLLPPRSVETVLLPVLQPFQVALPAGIAEVPEFGRPQDLPTPVIAASAIVADRLAPTAVVPAMASFAAAIPERVDATVPLPLAPAAAIAEPQMAAARPPGLVVRARADTWLQVRDGRGETLIARVLRAGEEWTPPQVAGLRLTTGNAGGTELVVNGAPLPPLGQTGVVRRDVLLEIPRQ